MNNKFIFFLFLLKACLGWRKCLDWTPSSEATNRVSGSATVVGDDIYLIGGLRNFGSNRKRPNDLVYKITYNSCDNIKFELKNTKIDIYDHAAVYIPTGEFKDCIFIFGGESVFSEDHESIFYYNTSSDSLGNITMAEFSYISSQAYYIKELNKVALVGGYMERHVFNSISYFNLNTQEIESGYNNNPSFSSAKRFSFSSSINEIEDKNRDKTDTFITYFGGYNQNEEYTRSLYQYNTTIPSNAPVHKNVDGPDINREYTKGVGYKHYLLIHGGTFYYATSFYLSEKTLLYDIKNNKMMEIKDERFGVWRHDSVIIKNDLLLVVGGAGTKYQIIGYSVLNLSTVTLQEATDDVFNPLMYYLIGAGCVVLVGICMCCCLYCGLSYYARRRYEQQAIGIERILNGMPQRVVPEDLLNVITKDTYTAHKFHHQTCCTICIVEFEENEKIKVLPCQHIFHPECIDQWLHHKDICPVCKREVLNERGSRIASAVAWEENSVDEIKQNEQTQQQQQLPPSPHTPTTQQQQQPNEVEMARINNNKSSNNSITINVAPAGSGSNFHPRTSTPNTNRRQVVTPNSISLRNGSAKNSINNSVHFQPPNIPFDDMSGL